MNSQGTDSHDGGSGNRSLLLAAGPGTMFRTEPAEVTDGRGEPSEK